MIIFQKFVFVLSLLAILIESAVWNSHHTNGILHARTQLSAKSPPHFSEEKDDPEQFLGCKDDNDRAVDWLIMYKIPIKTIGMAENSIGDRYVYASSLEFSNWALSNKSIVSQDNLLANTVAPIIKGQIETDSLFVFNDYVPGSKENHDYSQSKGILIYSKRTAMGFWIFHSIPNFVTFIGEPYRFPPTALSQGHIAVCISFPITTTSPYDLLNTTYFLNNFMEHLKPRLYFGNSTDLPATSHSQIHGTQNSVNQNFGGIVNVPGNNGMVFYAFYKWGCNKTIYEDLIDHFNSVQIAVKSQKAGHLQDKIRTIQGISIKPSGFETTISWSSAEDSSKWFVNDFDPSLPVVCFNDIDLILPRKNKIQQWNLCNVGGASLCFLQSDMSSLLRKSVV